MKRKLSFLLLIAMLVSVIPGCIVSAAITTEYFVYRTEVNDDLVYNLAVSGAGASNTDIRMIAYKKDAPSVLTDFHIKAIDQTVTDSDGKFSFLVSLVEKGTYIIEISENNMTTPHTFEFEIKDDSYYEGIVELFKDSSGALETEELLAEYSDEMFFSSDFFNADTPGNIRTAIAREMYEKRNSMNIENAVSIFDESVILAYMKLNGDYSTAEKILETYEDVYINLKSTDGALNLYNTFVAYPQLKEPVFKALMNKEYKMVSDIQKAFREAFIVEATANLSISELSDVIGKNEDYLGIKYTSLEDVAKSTILTHVLKKKALISSKATFLKYYKEGVALLDNKGSSGNTGGGGGGGGSSSGVKVDPELIDVPKPEIFEAPQMFKDLDSVAWAYDSIKYLYDNGIVSGKSNGNFCPDDYVTREEFAKMLAGALELTEESYDMYFTDVPEDAWYYTYVSRLKRQELIKGYEDGSFGTGKYITREDMATIIYRAITILYFGDKIENIENSKDFADIDSVSEYAVNSVVMLSNMNIINGVGENTFAPKKNATRAETAVIIHRVMNLKGRNEI